MVEAGRVGDGKGAWGDRQRRRGDNLGRMKDGETIWWRITRQAFI